MAIRAPNAGRPTSEASARIADRIIEAAWDVLLEHGPEQLSVDKVALAAHASKQTIYARFSGKMSVLRAVLDTRVGALVVEMRTLYPGVSLEDSLVDLARRSVAFLVASKSRMIDRLVDWIDSNSSPEEHQPVRGLIHSEILQELHAMLEAARLRWSVEFIDADRAASFWLEGIIGHVRSNREHVDADWPGAFVAYFLRGACVRS